MTRRESGLHRQRHRNLFFKPQFGASAGNGFNQCKK